MSSTNAPQPSAAELLRVRSDELAHIQAEVNVLNNFALVELLSRKCFAECIAYPRDSISAHALAHFAAPCCMILMLFLLSSENFCLDRCLDRSAEAAQLVVARLFARRRIAATPLDIKPVEDAESTMRRVLQPTPAEQEEYRRRMAELDARKTSSQSAS